MTNDHDEPIIRPINQSQARLNHKSNSLRSSNPLSSLGRQLNDSHDVYSGFANIEKSLDDRLNEVEPYENASSADTLAKTRKMNSYMNNYSKVYGSSKPHMIDSDVEPEDFSSGSRSSSAENNEKLDRFGKSNQDIEIVKKGGSLVHLKINEMEEQMRKAQNGLNFEVNTAEAEKENNYINNPKNNPLKKLPADLGKNNQKTAIKEPKIKHAWAEEAEMSKEIDLFTANKKKQTTTTSASTGGSVSAYSHLESVNWTISQDQALLNSNQAIYNQPTPKPVQKSSKITTSKMDYGTFKEPTNPTTKTNVKMKKSAIREQERKNEANRKKRAEIEKVVAAAKRQQARDEEKARKSEQNDLERKAQKLTRTIHNEYASSSPIQDDIIQQKLLNPDLMTGTMSGPPGGPFGQSNNDSTPYNSTADDSKRVTRIDNLPNKYYVNKNKTQPDQDVQFFKENSPSIIDGNRNNSGKSNSSGMSMQSTLSEREFGSHVQEMKAWFGVFFRFFLLQKSKLTNLRKFFIRNFPRISFLCFRNFLIV